MSVSPEKVQRRYWSIEEERALIDGVAKHGKGRWARILVDDQFADQLALRSGGNCKDKWRQIGFQHDSGPPKPSDIDRKLATKLKKKRIYQLKKDLEILKSDNPDPALYHNDSDLSSSQSCSENDDSKDNENLKDRLAQFKRALDSSDSDHDDEKYNSCDGASSKDYNEDYESEKKSCDEDDSIDEEDSLAEKAKLFQLPISELQFVLSGVKKNLKRSKRLLETQVTRVEHLGSTRKRELKIDDYKNDIDAAEVLKKLIKEIIGVKSMKTSSKEIRRASMSSRKHRCSLPSKKKKRAQSQSPSSQQRSQKIPEKSTKKSHKKTKKSLSPVQQNISPLSYQSKVVSTPRKGEQVNSPTKSKSATPKVRAKRNATPMQTKKDSTPKIASAKKRKRVPTPLIRRSTRNKPQ